MYLNWLLAVPLALACVLPAQQPGAGFAVVGVAASQTARINVLNEAGSGPAAGPAQDSEVMFDCRVVLRFLGSEGQLLKEKVVENLAAGKIAFLDLTAADRPPKELRTPVRAVALFGYSGGANPPRGLLEACRVTLSLEIFDSESGKAEIVLTEAKALPASSKSVP